jgi:hypothetical protein
MEAKIEVRIKLDDNRELVMDEKDAKALYDKLHSIFGNYYYTYPWRVTYTDTNNYVPNTPPAPGTIYCTAREVTN